MSNLDIDALLSENGRGNEVTADNEIPSFKQMLGSNPDDDKIVDASEQLCTHIRHRITTASFDRALGAMALLRDTSIEYELPGIYNDFLQDLKAKVFSEELGGDRTEFWHLLVAKKLGLIKRPPPDSRQVEQDAAPGSKVTDQEAADFLRAPARDVEMT